MKKLSTIIVTFFYIGNLPFSGAAVASLASIPIILGLHKFDLIYEIAAIMGLFGGAIFFSTRYERFAGKKDPKAIVIDEVIGMLFGGIFFQDIIQLLILFFGFRILDNLKPWPIKSIEKKFTSGFAIVIDDVIAGIMAATILLLLLSGLGINSRFV